MANRAAFEIDLPVEELKSFIDDYKGFKEALKQQPDEWAAVGDAISDLIEPIDKIINSVSGISEASAAAVSQSAAIAELTTRRIQMTEEQTNLIIAQRADLEERVARRKLDQQKKDEEAAKKSQGHTDIFTLSATKSAKLFTKMDDSSAKLFMRLKDSTGELLKWGGILTGIGSLVGGLIGAGGLFGMSSIANKVMDTAKDAQGLGVTYGEGEAFGVNYKNIVDSPSGVLEGIVNAKNNPQSGLLQRLGIPAADIKNKDAAQLAPEVLAAVRALYKQTNGNTGILNDPSGYNLGQLGFSTDDERRLADPKTDLAGTAKQFQSDALAMDLPPAVQDAWTALAKQLDRTKDIFENDLIKAITPLAPALTALSADFIGVIATLLQLPEVKEGLTAFDSWLKQFSAYLKSDEFQKDLKNWEAELRPVLRDIGDDFKSFQKGLDPGGKPGHWTGIPYLSTFKSDDPKDQGTVPYEYQPDNFMNDIGEDKHMRAWWKRWTEGLLSGGDFGGLGGSMYQNQDYTFIRPTSPTIVQADYEPTAPGATPPEPFAQPPTIIQADYEPYTPGAASEGSPEPFAGQGLPPDQFGGLEGAYGLPPGLLGRIRQVESGGNDSAVSAAGAEGPFQFMPGTAAQYGVQNPFDLSQAAPAAAKMFSDLMTEFHGDLRESVAAYNWGAGNVANDVATHGADWESHLPHETIDYLARVLGNLNMKGSSSPAHAPAQVKIDVSNRTGGSAIITTRTIAT